MQCSTFFTYLRTYYLLTHLYLLYGQVELELEMLCETSDAFLDLVAGRPTNPMADRLAPVQPRIRPLPIPPVKPRTPVAGA